ncbi:hypothetical protein ANANG_G00112690, partial [Anguilla anguilla]
MTTLACTVHSPITRAAHITANTIAQSEPKDYMLSVPVSKPHLNVTHNEYRCTILCAVVRADLTLYKNSEKKPYVTSPVESAPHLHLPQTVHKGGIYTCEARNSVSNETSDPLTVGAHCTGELTAPHS